jgi:hypothetical protein
LAWLDAEISNSIIKSNTNKIFILGSGKVKLQNVLMFNNDFDYLFRDVNSIQLFHCTITKNVIRTFARICNGGLLIYNSIIYGNEIATTLFCDWNCGLQFYFSNIQLECTNYCYANVNTINVDPQFLAPDSLNFRLRPGSPCIDAGSPDYATTVDLDGYPRDRQPDMGAYEAHWLAGDVDLSGTVNLADLRLALQAALGIAYLSADQALLADLDGDGRVTLVDVEEIAGQLIGARD